MAGSPLLQAFISDFSNNTRALREMGYMPTDQRLALLQSEAALESSKIWQKVAAMPGEWQRAREWLSGGRGIERKANDWITGGVYAIQRLETPTPDGAQYVALAGRIVLLDENLSFVAYRGQYGAPQSNTQSYAYAYDIRVNEAQDKIAVVCGHPYNLVRVYRFSDFSHLYDVGTVYASDNDPASGVLYNPISVDWHPNGNLLIACQRGGSPTGGNGYVAEYDGATGAYVQTLLSEGTQQPKGEPWNNGGIYWPVRIRVLNTPAGDSRLWVASNSQATLGWRDWIAEYDLTAGVPAFLRAYREPDEFPLSSLSARDFYVDYDNDQLTVVNYAVGAIITIGLTDRDLKAISGVYARLDYSRPAISDTENPHMMAQPLSIAPYGTDGKRFYVGTNIRSGIMPVWWKNQEPIQYDLSDLPAGFRLADETKHVFNVDENGKRIADVWTLDSADEIPVMLERVY